IAAPSMKAALEAWGADSNLFHQGAAKENGTSSSRGSASSLSQRENRSFGRIASMRSWICATSSLAGTVTTANVLSHLPVSGSRQFSHIPATGTGPRQGKGLPEIVSEGRLHERGRTVART